MKNESEPKALKEVPLLEAQEKEFDKVLSELGFGAWQWLLILVLCVGSVADATEINLLSFLAPCVEDEWDLSSFATSCITGVVFVGEIVGAFIFGPLADHKGRRFAYSISLGLMICGGVATYFSVNYVQLILCQAVVGIGVGGVCVPFDYLAEVMPAKRRGTCLMVSGLMWGIGSVLVTTWAWLLLNTYGWKLLALICAAPVIVALLLVFLIPESPRWLLLKGRSDEAVQALQSGATWNKKVLGDFKLKPAKVSKKEGDFREVFKGSLLWPSLQLCANWGSFGFAYYSIVYLISDLLEDTDSSSSCSFSYEDIFLSALSEPFFTLFALYFIDKSRVRLSIVAYLGAGIFTLLLGTTFDDAWLTAFAFIARGCINVGAMTTWVMTPEYYPTEIRSSGHGLFFVIARAGAFLAGFWVYSGLDDLVICIGIAIFCFIPSIVSMFMKETAGHSLDEIQGES
mmetsp:Transcript_30041/g.39526  ORF Transcript_30041/g.39526 Transcript_30041/m.39526 type:complete len:457 (-) Transcript_30041:367-1737(-)